MSNVPASDSAQRPRSVQIYSAFILVIGLITIYGIIGSPENLHADDLNSAATSLAVVYLLFFLGLAIGVWQRRRWARLLAIGFHVIMVLSGITILSQSSQPLLLGIVVALMLVNLSVLIWLWRHSHYFGSAA